VDHAPWIADYDAYLKSNGYAVRIVRSRLKHLRSLVRFAESRGMNTLEEFGPNLVGDFIAYWVRHQPWARTSRGFRRKSRYRPRHHIAIHYSLHCFFRWAYSTGCLQRDVFPLRPAVRGNYFFPEVSGYLRFCEEHKGLAKNSMLQIELFLRRFDQFLDDHKVRAWSELTIDHIDLFVRQQASRNIKRIQRVHKVLRGLFRYLFSTGRVERDWAPALISPRRFHLAHTPRALAAAQVLHLLRSIDRTKRGGRRNFALILMAASLGVRASELAALRLEHLDWARAVVTFPPVKGKRFLRLPLSRPLIEALADYLKYERPSGSSCRNVFVGLTPPFGPLRPGSTAFVIARNMHRAGIRSSGHQLRHAFARELLRTGTSLTTLQELLGHSQISSTQPYTKIDLLPLREVADNDAEGL
jgi:site-specific recombinase XerD